MRRARSFYTLFPENRFETGFDGFNCLLAGDGWEFCRVFEGGGWGYPPLLMGLTAALQVFEVRGDCWRV